MKNYVAIGRKLNISDFGLLPANWDLSWIEGTSGGGGGGAIQAVDDFSPQCNGVLQAFTLSVAPSVATNIILVWNGLTQRRGASFTNSGTSLTTTFIPATGDTLVAYIG